jgi:hypothetical protein
MKGSTGAHKPQTGCDHGRGEGRTHPAERDDVQELRYKKAQENLFDRDPYAPSAVVASLVHERGLLFDDEYRETKRASEMRLFYSPEGTLYVEQKK